MSGASGEGNRCTLLNIESFVRADEGRRHENVFDNGDGTYDGKETGLCHEGFDSEVSLQIRRRVCNDLLYRNVLSCE